MIFVFDLLIAYPTTWSQLGTKLFSLLWTIVYLVYWLVGLRFPNKFTHFSPIVVGVINIITLYYYAFKIRDLDDETSETVNKQILFCFVA